MPEQLYHRYRELQDYVGWKNEDAERVRASGDLLRLDLPDLVDDFYAEIERHPEAKEVISGGALQIERLRGSLLRWLEELFSGIYDREYVARRWKVGYRHVEIGLAQVYTNVALSRLRRGLLHVLEIRWPGEQTGFSAACRSLNTLLDLDLAIIEDAYSTEFAARLKGSERLAAIGQFSSGVAHELRNPLNVIKTSVYFLLTAKNPTADKITEHLRRIERQVGAADNVITTLSNFAKMPAPQRLPVPVEQCLREMLPEEGIAKNVELTIVCAPALAPVLIDLNQLRIAFRNLIRNAQEAMPNGGHLCIEARPANGRIAIVVRDTGCGISADELRRIVEPFHSTKARGVGLGLALARAIIDRNHGRLRIESEVGIGSTFTVELPAAAQPPETESTPDANQGETRA